MSLLKLTLKSINSRRLSTSLLVLSIGLSTMLLIGVQKVKVSAKESFSHSISSTDLIVGARSGNIQLLLYTVFRQGQAVANMSWESLEQIRRMPQVAWVVPISLGDSHRGYAVVGTNNDYFKHYKYGKKRDLHFQSGKPFATDFDVVLGAEVARKLRYKLGDRIRLSHGMGKGNLTLHDHVAFTVTGILNATQTPVDKSVHIPLEGMTALHVDGETIKAGNLAPSSITGSLIGLRSKFSIFMVQQRILKMPNEALMAIIPGVSLAQLWSNMRTIDTAFLVITILVVFIAFIGLLLAMFMSLQQRQREMAILRTLGAHPSQLFALLAMESALISIAGVATGGLLLYGVSLPLQPLLEARLGLILSVGHITGVELGLAGGIIGSGILIGFIPAWLAYKKSLSKGLLSL